MKYIRHEEIFDQPYPYPAVRRASGDRYRTVFYTDDRRRVDVIIDKLTDDFGSVRAEFEVDGKVHTTGEGDSFRIFATVITIIKEYMDRYPDVPRLVFSSFTDSSRIKLYHRLIKKYAVGYQIDTKLSISQLVYILTR